MKAARRILRPTAAGLFWFLATLVLIATAINYGNNLVFALAFLLFSIWASAAWECWRNLSGLEWTPSSTPPVFAGENLHPCVNLRDPTGHSHAGLFLEIRAGRGRLLAGAPTDLGRGAGPQEYGGLCDSAPLELACPAPARGRQTLGKLRLSSTHPLGLWQASRPLPDLAALVYPHPAGGQPLPARSPRPAHRRQEAGDFQGVRAHAPGDSPRRVNWRIYARREELVVNTFDGGAGGHALWLDLSACPGDLEARLSQLCQWVLAAGRDGLEYGLRLEGEPEQPPGRGRAHREACLARLALYRNRDRTTGTWKQDRPTEFEKEKVP
ncbi:MAG: DUF58 domain-containing protein [Zoogloeaceae bacterium]|jgi:uncharacterized protein (DUF58 family)|nr:DUF58 domain-containing protein [Zoogloeaceae bacterium]